MPDYLAPSLLLGVLGVAAFAYTRTKTTPPKSKMSGMSAPNPNLAPPQDRQFNPAELAQYDGTEGKPIYVAIKGVVYDVSAKKEMYGKGSGYNVFAGKDASCGLGEEGICLALTPGMSSLDPKDAHADFSNLNDTQKKTLDDWSSFFAKVSNCARGCMPTPRGTTLSAR